MLREERGEKKAGKDAPSLIASGRQKTEVRFQRIDRESDSMLLGKLFNIIQQLLFNKLENTIDFHFRR